MHFWQDEEEHNSYIVMGGYEPSMESPDRIESLALITGAGCVQSIFGYPNEDAWWKDPRRQGHDWCYEIEDSQWASSIQDYNRRSFGADYFRTDSALQSVHHYFIGSKDGSCQILARNLAIEVLPDRSLRQIIELVYRRSRERFAETLRRIDEMQQGRQVPGVQAD
jgi:hypothetical protein